MSENRTVPTMGWDGTQRQLRTYGTPVLIHHLFYRYFEAVSKAFSAELLVQATFLAGARMSRQGNQWSRFRGLRA
jgi:hypothetical protein